MTSVAVVTLNGSFTTDILVCLSRVSQLESNLSKKDEIIAAKDSRIAALEAVQVSAASSTDCKTALHRYGASIQNGNNKTNDAANEVSDESCDAESGSFGSLGLSFLRHDSSRDDDSDAAEESPDGRWNVPFDETNEDDLVPKSSTGEVLSHATALKDIGFQSISGDVEDQASSGLLDGLAAMHVSSPSRPDIFRSGISPIVRTARLGLSRTDSHGSDKENIDPILKRLSADKCTLAQGFGSPCR